MTTIIAAVTGPASSILCADSRRTSGTLISHFQPEKAWEGPGYAIAMAGAAAEAQWLRHTIDWPELPDDDIEEWLVGTLAPSLVEQVGRTNMGSEGETPSGPPLPVDVLIAGPGWIACIGGWRDVSVVREGWFVIGSGTPWVQGALSSAPGPIGQAELEHAIEIAARFDACTGGPIHAYRIGPDPEHDHEGQPVQGEAIDGCCTVCHTGPMSEPPVFSAPLEVPVTCGQLLKRLGVFAAPHHEQQAAIAAWLDENPGVADELLLSSIAGAGFSGGSV